jgi:hypothetical protein
MEQYIDLTVDYAVDFIQQPLRLEECHGLHYFDDSSYEICINRIYIEIKGRKIDITDRLNTSELKAIEGLIDPEIDNR